MGRLLTVVVVLLLAITTSADLVACPDGCTDEDTNAQATTVTASACPLCHGWTGAFLVLPFGSTSIVVRAEHGISVRPCSPYHPAIERPPKRA